MLGMNSNSQKARTEDGTDDDGRHAGDVHED